MEKNADWRENPDYDYHNPKWYTKTVLDNGQIEYRATHRMIREIKKSADGRIVDGITIITTDTDELVSYVEQISLI